MAVAVAGLGLFATVGPSTAFFPTIFFACFAIGLGIGNAFMPLLTIAMADVPPADAGLGSGITNVSQQISGALGLAVLSTLATDHTKALLASHHDLTTSLISGYRVAFLIGAAAITIGIALALALLRPRRAQLELQLAGAAGADEPAPFHTRLEMEHEAA
jgi:MFS family permease